MKGIREIYRSSDEYAGIASIALFTVSIGVLLIMIYSSASLVLGALAGLLVLVLAFLRPTWALALLLFYLPFEPFILKWVPDDLYVYARYVSEGIIYLLVASTVWKRFTGQIKRETTPIDISFVILIVVALASALINFIPVTDMLLGIRQIIRFILLFFVTVHLAPSTQWVKKVLMGLFLILAVQIALGYGQAIFGERLDTFLLPTESRSFGDIQLTSGTVQFWDYGQRIFGTMGRYDRLGTFMAFMLLIGLSMLYEKKLRKRYSWLGWGLLIALPALAFTYSRSSWFGFVLGALFIAIWAKRDQRVRWGVGIAIGGLLIYLAISGLVVDTLLEVPDQNLTERFFEAFSYERWRSEYYGLGRVYWVIETIGSVIPASPVFGHGPGMFGGGAAAALSNTHVYEMLGLPFGVYGTQGYIDNNWLSLWGEIGTLGLGIYIWMYVTLFLTCVRVWRKSKDPMTRALALGVAAAMIAIVLNAFLATFLEVRTLASYLWVMGGVVVVLGKREKLIE
ncbi:hypothetical protein HON52_02885 [Candidatus Uhrbacteria bacterium]|jgi:O-antigen ligase|nr:hypothetical protein [Candidatus Uhrbacteria bacterium]